ncbi:MAG: DUF1579 domain-containing protein [Acidobacteriota bacterium]|nr:DUF1579 domain-containing protein [Acidobacteriota bacterium]MDH3786227.1 DUF1579 domain-containing protein [Acidobacteriota bacterium]
MKRPDLNPLLLFLTLLLACLPLMAQETEQPAEEPKLSRAQTMGQPSAAHEKIMAREGTWRVKAQMTMADGQVIENSGIMQSEASLDGRFLTSLFKGEFMGYPFLGRSVDGYDNETNKYVSLWFDNTSTQIVAYYGTSEDDGETITYFADTVDGETGEKVRLKSVHRAQSDSQHTVEEFRMSEGDEDWALTMRVISSR